MNFLTRQHDQHVASLLVFLSSAAWGVMWVPMRYAETLGLPPLWVQLLFVLFPAIVMAPFQWRATIRARDHWPVYAAVGLFISAGLACFSLGLLYGSVSKTTVLFYLTPIWVTIMGRVFLGEQNTLSRWLAIAGALFGGCLVLQINPASIRLESPDLFGLASGMLWAGGAVVLRRYPQADFRNTTFVQYLSGVLMMIAALLVFDVPTPSFTAIMSAVPVIFVAGACVFMPVMLMLFRISQYLSPGLVSILMLSEILVAVGSSAIWLGEMVSLWQAAGIMLILGAGVFVAFGDDATTTQAAKTQAAKTQAAKTQAAKPKT